jgi:ribosomal protein L44E
MSERALRLGDVVDDYCPRCRLLLNHDVASLFQGEIAKVTCRTCHNTHDYRHAQVPQKRKTKESEKKKLMDQVLAGLGRSPEPAPAETPAPPAAAAAEEPNAATSSAPPAGAPGVRKRRDLWAEYERIKGQKKD